MDQKNKKLRELVVSKVYNSQQLCKFGWCRERRLRYMRNRSRIWKKACVIFKAMMGKSLGEKRIFANKSYDRSKKMMKVAIHQHIDPYNTEVLIEKWDDDPIKALILCAKELKQGKDLISVLMKKFKI